MNNYIYNKYSYMSRKNGYGLLSTVSFAEGQGLGVTTLDCYPPDNLYKEVQEKNLLTGELGVSPSYFFITPRLGDTGG